MWTDDADRHRDSSAPAFFENRIGTGEAGSFTVGLPEKFAIGERASIVDGFIRLTVTWGNSRSVDPRIETARVLAITNLHAVDEGEFSLAFLSPGGSSQAVGLFNDDDHTEQSSYYSPFDIRTTPVIVPLPPPVGLALVGFIGVVWLRRRMIR